QTSVQHRATVFVRDEILVVVRHQPCRWCRLPRRAAAGTRWIEPVRAVVDLALLESGTGPRTGTGTGTGPDHLHAPLRITYTQSRPPRIVPHRRRTVAREVARRQLRQRFLAR